MYVAVAPAFSGYTNGHFKSKKALKEAIAAGHNVHFRDTSLFSPQDVDSDNIAAGADPSPIYVVGPSEYERKWFAQVTRKNGKVVVK